MEEDNARLSKRAAELEDSIAAADADVPANGMANSGGEGQGQQDGWEVVGEGEHDRARLEEVRLRSRRHDYRFEFFCASQTPHVYILYAQP